MGQKQSSQKNSPADGGVFLALGGPMHIPSLKSQVIFWSILVGGFLADIISKRLVFQWLEREGWPVEIVGQTLRFVIAENPGAAFGIAQGQTTMLVAVAVIALAAIIVLFFFSGRDGILMHLGLAFFAAGIAGNLWDRFFNDGRVRDFIDIQYAQGRHWPAFNLADTFLCVAVGLIILASLINRPPDQKHDPQQK